MKSLSEIPLIGLIGTITIIIGIILPPAIVKITLDREAALTVDFEKAQNALISLLFSVEDGENLYETIGTSIILDDIPSIPNKNNFDSLVNDYCISIIEDEKGKVVTSAITPPISERGLKELLKKGEECIEPTFNTLITVPYNKGDLVKIVGIGIK